MRRVAALLAILTAVATPAPAADAPSDRIDARMLLDLELLTESDPARHREQSLAERMRLLEVLRLLQSPAGATSTLPSTPAARPAAPPPADGGSK